ncbi:preATP grasp domain-containing protein [Arthrobacter sp. SA17]
MRKIDSRSYAAHGLWFIEPGDVAVLMDAPDEAFLDHVLAVKGWQRTAFVCA